MVDQVDLFHHDSDKMYASRQRALATVLPKMRPGSIVIFDDINVNPFFRDEIAHRGMNFKVFEFLGKYVGLFYV